MKADNNTMAYEAAPAVSELNKVAGFNPLKFVRKTERGYKLDLRYKKLWFRLKYPTGRIKLSPLRITDQLAIIEARVYFDKADTEPKASFIAQREAKTTPGGLYIEAAQHAAIDRALSDAGFGLQFPESNSSAGMQQESISKAEVTVDTDAIVSKQTVADAEMKNDAVEEFPVEPEQETPEQAMGRTSEQQAPITNEVQELGNDEASSANETAEEDSTAETFEQTEETAPASAYTPDMSVEEIMARMSYEEACNVKVSEGICNGRFLSEVADRRPASLKYYAHGYTGGDNVMRAAARIILSAIDQQKAS